MTEETRDALVQLAVLTAVQVERAPGPVERRLVLLRAFAEARRLNPALVEEPDLSLLNGLLRQREALVPNLQALWLEGPEAS
jgi:hypothetical protein